MNTLNARIQTTGLEDLTWPNWTDFSTIPTIRYPYFFNHTTLLNEIDGYLNNDTMYLEIFFWPPNTTYPVFFSFSFSVDAPNHFQHLVSGVSCRVSHNAKQC